MQLVISAITSQIMNTSSEPRYIDAHSLAVIVRKLLVSRPVPNTISNLRHCQHEFDYFSSTNSDNSKYLLFREPQKEKQATFRSPAIHYVTSVLPFPKTSDNITTMIAKPVNDE